MHNGDHPLDHGNASADGYLPADKTVVNNPRAVSQRDNADAGPFGSPYQQSAGPYGSPYQQGAQPASPGSTAPQRRIMQDAPTVQMPRPTGSQRGAAAGRPGRAGRGQQPYAQPVAAYGPDTCDPSPAGPDCAYGGATHRGALRQSEPQPRRGASALRWIARILCLGMLVFGAMTVYYLTEQSAADTSALSSGAGSLAEYGAYLVQSGQLPTFEENPVKWTAAHILLLSVKFSNHGLSVRQQAHVVEFALLGGVIALNVLAWMSGWAHRRSPRGRMRVWRTWLMIALAAGLCAAASFADQYHKLFVPGRHFDNFDLVLDASGYVPAILCVFVVWSFLSMLYRAVARK